MKQKSFPWFGGQQSYLKVSSTPGSSRLRPSIAAMFALFECCGGPFGGHSSTALGELAGPGYKQDAPLKVRLTCPTCRSSSETLFPQHYVMARTNANMIAGMRAITRPHIALLRPVQLVPGGWTHAHAEIEGQERTASPAFLLTVALESALSADPCRLNQMNMQAMADMQLNQSGISESIKLMINGTVHHCAMANACLGAPQANLDMVRFSFRPMPTK